MTTDLSRQLADLSPEQLEFLRRRLKKAVPKGRALPPVVRVSRDGRDFPLSSSQRRLWFQERLSPGDPVSNVGILTRVAGRLDRVLFVRTIEEIVRRHEVLRTTFVSVGQEPRQVVAPFLRIPLPEIDLCGLSEADREPEALRQAAELALLPFALDRGPMLRTVLFRLGEDQALLLIGFHHIVSDGWAFGIVVQEIGAIYRAFHRGEPHGLPEHEIQYIDFAHWQRQVVETEAVARQLAWWKEALTGAPPLLDLPADRPRPAVLGSRARKEYLLLPPALTGAMEDLADHGGATSFMAWLAAFQVFLSRWAGQPDFVIGAPVASRRSKELEGLVGMFINILPLRIRLSPEAGFRAFLGEVREGVLGAFANQDLPLERLAEELQLERHLSHSLLFQELFAFQNFRLKVEDLPGMSLIPLDWEVARSPMDLTLFLTAEPRGLLATLRYNLALFDDATVQRMAGSFGALLRSIAADPERPLADLDLLGEAERLQLQSEPGSGLRVLDERGRPVPAGVVGEIHTGSGEPRPTGELGRVTAEGEVRRVGRKNRRLMVRGYRIQAEEVERPLRLLPGVRDAWVVAADGHLVAWVAADPGVEAGPALWRESLRHVLPGYQVPAAYLTVERLPRTPSGEVDEAALTAPGTGSAAPARRGRAGAGFTAFVAPRTPAEDRVAEILRELLKLDEIGVYDSFFELGGHSLLAAQAAGRLGEAFGVELSVPDFFLNPTVEGMAARIEELTLVAEGQPRLPSLKRRERGLAPVSSPSQERLWFLHRLSPAGTAYNSNYALRFEGPLRPGLLQASIREIVRRHEVLRTRFEEVEGRPAPVISPEPDFTFGVVDLGGLARDRSAAEVDRLRAAEARTPFDLACGPLLRTLLLRLAADEHVFVSTNHHIVSDGWSTTVFVTELAALYRSLAAGEPSSLPPLRVQYADYAAWQWRLLREGALAPSLELWRSALAGAPSTIDLPLDRRRPASGGRRGGVVRSLLPASRVTALEDLAKQRGATLFMTLLGLLDVVLWRWSGQDDLVVGTVVANRNPPSTEALIGCFMNFLPLRCRITEGQTGNSLLASVRSAVLAAWTHQVCPFEKIVEAVSPDRSLNQNPLYNVALLLQSFPPAPQIGQGLRMIVLPQSTGESLLDLRLIASFDPGGGLALDWEYDAALFEERTIELVSRAFEDAAARLTGDPEAPLSRWQISAELVARAEEARRRTAPRTIAVAATFTAEPVEAPLRFWMKTLDLPYQVRFAPYGQVFQELLDPASLLARNRNGAGVVLVRLEDWIDNGERDTARRLLSQVRDFTSALATAAGRSGSPLLVGLCPAPPSADGERAELLAQAEQRIADGLAGLRGVSLLPPADLAAWEVAEIHDPVANELGHVPYTPAFFAVLGTAIARQVHGFATLPRKVVAVDCDGTLWNGVCGEDGPLGVEIDSSRRALQELLVELNRAGVLICLCSKNSEADVMEVFAQRRDMPLRTWHVVASRINWRPKSENLRSLAGELRLGLDSFVFLDDNPLECAEVRAACPEVLVLELPEEAREIPRFLRHVWAFDRRPLTAEDRARGELYREDLERERWRRETLSLSDFLAGLELRIDIQEMSPEDVPRVSQLTQRTNQFNLTTIRRSEEEVRDLCASGVLECRIVRVRDRFGDYGLVGALLFQARTGALRVDTFLLSCRALGRGVEHRMLSHLGEVARERGLAHVEIPCLPTTRNKPARDFLEAVGAVFRDPADPQLWVFPGDAVAGLSWQPESAPAPAEAPPEESTLPSVPPADSALANRIARELSRIDRLLAAIEEGERRERPGLGGPYEAPAGPVEESVAQVWARLLGLERVGRRDNFFHLGGHSLLATQLLARLAFSLGVQLPLQSVFENPTLAGLAELVERELASRESRGPSRIQPVPRDRPLPLSFAQQRLWFFDQWQPGSSVFNVPLVVRLSGQLRAAVLAATVEEIRRRHEVLRTVFLSHDGQPFPSVVPAEPLGCPVVDLAGLPGEAREREAERLVREEARRPFDLACGPLFRVALVRLAAQEHLAFFTLHHIVSDGWSIGVLVRELDAIYRAFAAGRPSPLPPLPIQYADFAHWQREWLQGEALGRQVDYWRRTLADAPAALELPTDQPRGALQTYRGARSAVSLPRELLAGLHAVGLREEATLFMVLLSGFTALLHRYTGESDVVVGTLIANRNRAEIESLIGFFVNNLALRLDSSGSSTLREVIERARRVTLEAYAHQDLPFEKLVEELNPDRHLSHNPYFQVVLMLQNAPFEALDLPGLRLHPVEVDRGTTNFDLFFSLQERETGLEGFLEYNVDLFEAATVDRLLGHYRALLWGLSADPGARIEDLELLSGAERVQVLAEWNDSGRGEVPGSAFPRLFEERAARDPERTAAVCSGERLSYAELNRRANRTAWRLVERGVAADFVVALLDERGLDLLTAVLGVLKAGGAWLPLDPHHPPSRMRRVLEQSRCRLVLVSSGLEERLAAALAGMADPPEVLDLAALAGEGAPEKDRPAHGGAGDLAYVIFTSGSTGLPKGAMLEHRGMINHLFAKVEDLGLGPSDVVAQTASQCFDISVWQMLAPLLVGGRVEIYPDEVARDPAVLFDRVEADGITVLETVPSLLRLMLEELERWGGARPGLRALRWLIPTGEALPPELCREWARVYPHVRLLNAYGPTECSDDVSHHGIEVQQLEQARTVPIGRPVRHLRLYVLDRKLRPVPVGARGELCVGGVGVGRGYLHDPVRTAAAFVPDPYGEAGARLYRTGDVARHRADGALEFLGRIDHQVKIRGFRIELGEIEAVLHEHPEVRQAAVIVHSQGRDSRLAAYLVAAGETGPAELRDFLLGRLPDYMVPAGFVFLDSLPLTPNGKVDRRRLPEPDFQPAGGGEEETPRTAVEELLAGIWAEVLRTERIGVNQSFFELGGHSLLATQLLARIRPAFPVELQLRDLFESPTIAGLARRIEAGMGAGEAEPLPPIARRPRDGRCELSWAQERLWFLDQLDPGNAAYNLPNAVLLTGPLDRAALAAALGEIVRRHEALRTLFGSAAGRPWQVVREPSPPAIPLIDLGSLPSVRADAEALWIAESDARRPFDLAAGPLWRCTLAALSTDRHVLVLNVHHTVSDGWSTGVLLAEVAGLYPAFRERLPSPLPELPVQYADFALWQRETFQGERLDRQLAYWRQQLAGMPEALDLPERISLPAAGALGAGRHFQISTPLASSLRALGRRCGATLFMTLLAGFAALLHRQTSATDLPIGVPTAGRVRAELERLIGFFVNTLVIRADLDGDPTGEALLERMRQVTLDAHAHQDLPFEKLVAELNPHRDLARSPLFQVMFVLQNAPTDRIEVPGLTLHRLRIETGTARFEMFLEMTEDGAGLAGTLHYRTDLFESSTIERLLSHYRSLLEGLASDSGARVGDLELLSAAERRQVLEEWNDTARGEVPDSAFPALFEERAAREPERPAASCNGARLSYGELNRRANRVAWRLMERGVGADSVVGLLDERGLDLLTAILGVLKSGGAYLPLDPRHPPSRIRQVLAQSRCRLILVSSGLKGRLSESLVETADPPQVLDLAALAAEGAAEQDPGARSSAGDLAYVIFTSGSTGLPKGAMLEHRGMVNHLLAKVEELGLGPCDAVAQTASQCFDISVWQMLAPLLVGGRVEIYPDEVAHDPSSLLDRVEGDGVTVLETVPSLLRLMLEELERRGGSRPGLRALRWLIPTGEALPPELCREWERVYPQVRLLNAYGPTECSDDVSHHRLDVQQLEETRTVPIGRPVRHLRLYVLDRQLRPVPVGARGELCVGGVGVGRGYLHDPVRTAAAFVPDPYGEAGARLYRTGDLARHRAADGVLEFLGRIDHQVKIRGFRIELGEIEAVLHEHPGIAAAVVMARPETSGTLRLVAYVVPHGGREISLPELREFLKPRLPEHAIPSACAMLAEIPLTPNGKVDRRALPEVPDAEGPRAEAQAPPRNEVEEEVAAVFASVIGRGAVGIYDNFFDLGGHSLLATQAVARLRESFGVDLALRELFEAPTVAELAAVIEARVIEQLEGLSDEQVDSLLTTGA